MSVMSVCYVSYGVSAVFASGNTMPGVIGWARAGACVDR